MDGGPLPLPLPLAEAVRGPQAMSPSPDARLFHFWRGRGNLPQSDGTARGLVQDVDRCGRRSIRTASGHRGSRSGVGARRGTHRPLDPVPSGWKRSGPARPASSAKVQPCERVEVQPQGGSAAGRTASTCSGLDGLEVRRQVGGLWAMSGVPTSVPGGTVASIRSRTASFSTVSAPLNLTSVSGAGRWIWNRIDVVGPQVARGVSGARTSGAASCPAGWGRSPSGDGLWAPTRHGPGGP